MVSTNTHEWLQRHGITPTYDGWIPPPDFGTGFRDFASVGLHPSALTPVSHVLAWLPPPPTSHGDAKTTYVVNEEVPGAGGVSEFEMRLLTDPTFDGFLASHGVGQPGGVPAMYTPTLHVRRSVHSMAV